MNVFKNIIFDFGGVILNIDYRRPEQEFTKLGIENFHDLFYKIYFSHHLHLRKPEEKIFQLVMDENNLVASETLFIDDSRQHLEGAKKEGLQTLLLEQGKTISDYF